MGQTHSRTTTDQKPFNARKALSKCAQQSSSPFFQLPPEIRNMIYKYVLSHPRNTTTVELFEGPENWSRIQKRRLQLLQVCRLVYHESIPFMIERKRMDMYNRDAFPLRQIGQNSRDLIRAVRIVYWGACRDNYRRRRRYLERWRKPPIDTVDLEIFALLRTCPNLESLQIPMWKTEYERYNIKDFARHPVCKLRGLKYFKVHRFPSVTSTVYWRGKPEDYDAFDEGMRRIVMQPRAR